MPKQSRASEYADRDCFAEFILGRAEGETRGLAMTIWVLLNIDNATFTLH
jgi:hypothetical protein